MLDWLLDRMAQAADAPAIAHGAQVSSYRELLVRVEHWQRLLAEHGIAGVLLLAPGTRHGRGGAPPPWWLALPPSGRTGSVKLNVDAPGSLVAISLKLGPRIDNVLDNGLLVG